MENIVDFLMIIAIILILIFLGVFFYTQTSIFTIGSDSVEVFNKTQGKFTVESRPALDFEDYYDSLKTSKENNLPSVEKNESSIIRLEYDYKFYNKEKKYFDRCGGKKLKINFTNPTYSEFVFNYSNNSFNYKINTYSDLYHFSDQLKNQDCYFDEEEFPQRYFMDPYNIMFIRSISNDFKKLRNMGYSYDKIVEIAVLFVQSIPYGTDPTETNRYPYETIHESEGNCLDKSVILAGILENLGYSPYIIMGDLGEEYHALVGLICDKGNVIYDGSEICFIETTMFSPVGQASEINSEVYIKISEGDFIYSGKNYGFGLVNFMDSKKSEIKNIESDLESMKLELQFIKEKMCNTDCMVCGNETITKEYCYNAIKYNGYLEDYNMGVENYNDLIKGWYESYYDLENLMFNNVEFIQKEKL